MAVHVNNFQKEKMKAFLFFTLLCIGQLAGAQTPIWTNSLTGDVYTNLITDKSGYVTNGDYLKPFSMTNYHGQLIANAVMVNLAGNRFIYKTPDGAEGTARWSMLSPELRRHFRYDPAKETNADMIDNLKTEAWDLQKIEAQQNDQQAALRSKVMKYRTCVYGDVVQKIRAGLLVSSPGSVDRDMESHIILIKHYSNESNVAADDQITCWAYPLGIYSYTTVRGSENTVHAWTCDFQEAVDYYCKQ